MPENPLPALTEQTKFLITAIGLAIVALGYLWLIIRAFQTKTMWGFAVLLVPGLGPVIFAVVHFTKALLPLIVMLVGGVVSAAPFFFPDPPPKPIVEQKEGGTHGTISGGGSEKNANDFVREQKNAAVLQMAARTDVTDETLELLRGAPNLIELDLNNTPITDKSLEIFATMPKLEKLRVARTKITAEGVQKHILTSKTIKELDVAGLNVTPKVMREWKNADPQNRKAIY